MTRTFLLFSSLCSALLLAAALCGERWSLAALAGTPAAVLHAVVLLVFARAKQPRRKAYFAVLRKPVLLSILGLAMVPLAGLLGTIPHLIAAWFVAIQNMASFHMEYQSIRESEHALKNGD